MNLGKKMCGYLRMEASRLPQGETKALYSVIIIFNTEMGQLWEETEPF